MAKITNEDINGRMGPDPNRKRLSSEEISALEKELNARPVDAPDGFEIGQHPVRLENWPDINLGSRLTDSNIE
jgi:hypothetical protein